MSVAYALATGQNLFGWRSSGTPRSVLFIDPELDAYSLQQRADKLARGFGINNSPDFNRVRWLNNDTMNMGSDDPVSLNLALSEHQGLIESLLRPGEVLIVDSLSVCYEPTEVSSPNAEEWWLPMQRFLLRLRMRGNPAIVAVHANKMGDHSGTQAKLRIFNTTLSLKHPQGYKMEDGAHFVVAFHKLRDGTGGAAEPVEVRLEDAEHCDGYVWTLPGQKVQRDIEIARSLVRDRKSRAEIAKKLGCHPTTVSRRIPKALRRARDLGLLTGPLPEDSDELPIVEELEWIGE